MPDQSAERWFVVVWLIVSMWLLACAFLIAGETGDGYQTIANARYFFGENPSIYAQRGPLAALLLWPVEVVATSFDLNPLNVRPYHLYSGMLHSAYLIGCWLLLKRSTESFLPRITAFAVSILSVAYYANAPFLSHDIIPGFLFLLFIFLCDRWIRKPSMRDAAMLVVLGSAAVLIKQTYAIFWLSVVVYVVLAGTFRWQGSKISIRQVSILFLLAGLSAVISWVGYAWFLGAEIPSVGLLERPLRLIETVSTQYDPGADLDTLFPADLYIRNWHNYGIAAVLLLIPGIFHALRGSDARMKMIAVCVLICLTLMQLTTFREVRYLIFLAPLVAMLVAPIVAIVLKSRIGVLVLLVTVSADQYRGLTMAASQLSASAGMNVERFVGAPSSNGKLISSEHLSFAFMAESPMVRDRYHGLFHLTADSLNRLHEGAVDVRRVRDPRDLGLVGVQSGDRVLYGNRTVVRQPPWQADNTPYALDQLILAAGYATPIQLINRGSDFFVDGYEGRFIMLIPDADIGRAMPLIFAGQLPATELESIYGKADGDELQKLGLVLDSICQADHCTYYD